MGSERRLSFGLVVLLIVVAVLFISMLIDEKSQEGEHKEDASDVLTYTMVGPNDGYCRGLINRFSEEFGVQTEYIRLVDESKIVVLIVAGNEYLPDLVIASQEKALDLARTGALVDMAPLLAQAGVDIDSLQPENRRYPAVYEGKRLFFRVPSRVPVDLYVALLKGEK